MPGNGGNGRPPGGGNGRLPGGGMGMPFGPGGKGGRPPRPPTWPGGAAATGTLDHSYLREDAPDALRGNMNERGGVDLRGIPAGKAPPGGNIGGAPGIPGNGGGMPPGKLKAGGKPPGGAPPPPWAPGWFWGSMGFAWAWPSAA